MRWPDVEEQQRSLHEGFPVDGGLWSVAASYRIANGVLLPDGPMARRYLPAAYPQLATELAKIDGGGEVAILAFAHNWGSLGYAPLVQADRTLSKKARERQVQGFSGGDPVAWIEIHAHAVRVALDLLGYLTSDTSDADQGLRVYVDALRTGLVDSGPEVRVGCGHRTIHMSFSGFVTRDELDEDYTRAWARAIIAGMVNPNLQGLHPQLDHIHAIPNFMLTYRFTGLVEIIYWHLSQFVVGQMGLARCEACGAYFPQTDKRQRFCPPEEWASSRAESRCAKRARMRRLRAKEGRS
jgi:hypothetical protein